MKYVGINRLFVALREYADYCEVCGSSGVSPVGHLSEVEDMVADALSRKFRGGLFVAMNRFYGRNVSYRKGWIL